MTEPTEPTSTGEHPHAADGETPDIIDAPDEDISDADAEDDDAEDDADSVVDTLAVPAGPVTAGEVANTPPPPDSSEPDA